MDMIGFGTVEVPNGNSSFPLDNPHLICYKIDMYNDDSLVPGLELIIDGIDSTLEAIKKRQSNYEYAGNNEYLDQLERLELLLVSVRHKCIRTKNKPGA